MFVDAVSHVARISRVLRQPGGNCLLLGVGGSGRQSLTRLATAISDFECFQIEITSELTPRPIHAQPSHIPTNPTQPLNSPAHPSRLRSLSRPPPFCLCRRPATPSDLDTLHLAVAAPPASPQASTLPVASPSLPPNPSLPLTPSPHSLRVIRTG